MKTIYLSLTIIFLFSEVGFAMDPLLCESCYHDEGAVSVASIAEVSDKIKEYKSLCDFTSQSINENYPNRSENCLKLLLMSEDERGLPQKALVYALKTFKINFDRLHSGRECIDEKLHPKGPEGIKNPCQMLINDMNSVHESVVKRGTTRRANSYYIDLCTPNGESIVSKSYVNKGTGSDNGAYTDIDGEKTTIIGAFLTDDKVTKFTPEGKTAKYKSVLGWKESDSRCNPENILSEGGGTNCPAIRLEVYGFQSSNNTSDSGAGRKPIHTSPYFSSIGCPSVGQDDNWKIVNLAVNGPSLVLNWGPEKYHSEESLTNCRNN